MEISVEMQDEIAVVTLGCENLDIDSLKEFRAQIMPLLDTHDTMVFDLSQLKFIDSTGLGFILSCLRKLNAKNGDLKLCGVTQQVRSLIEVFRLQRTFVIFASREEAVKSFSDK